MKVVTTPKPVPASFATEPYFGVNAFEFTNAEGKSRFGRYRILPVAGNDYLDAETAAAQQPNFLFDELRGRIASGPIRYRILVQLARDSDVTDDATVR